MCLRLPSGAQRPGWRHIDPCTLGAVPPEGVGGSGDEYRLRKCFDLIPQSIVLVLALELGMDPGVAKALGSLYKQLRRAFKVAGCLGTLWRATNGILQSCPPSVILLNVLTAMWKWEVEALREQICVATVSLPPVLVTVEADSLSDRGVREATLRRSPSRGCSCRCRARGWWPSGRRAMLTTPRRWRRGRRPPNGQPPRRRRGSP